MAPHCVHTGLKGHVHVVPELTGRMSRLSIQFDAHTLRVEILSSSWGLSLDENRPNVLLTSCITGQELQQEFTAVKVELFMLIIPSHLYLGGHCRSFDWL